MSEEQINELIEYNLDYSIEEDLEETKKCLKEANEEIERLIISLQAQEELTMNWYNKVKKAIEYIDRRDIEWGSEEHNKLLNILKGNF